MSFSRNLSNKYGSKLLDTATKTGLDVAETGFKKVVCKAAVSGELIGNKITEKNLKPKSVPDIDSENVKEITIQ